MVRPGERSSYLSLSSLKPHLCGSLPLSPSIVATKEVIPNIIQPSEKSRHCSSGLELLTMLAFFSGGRAKLLSFHMFFMLCLWVFLKKTNIHMLVDESSPFGAGSPRLRLKKSVAKFDKCRGCRGPKVLELGTMISMFHPVIVQFM